MSARVLIIDSRPEEAAGLAGWLTAPLTAEVEGDPEAGLRRLAEGSFDAVVLEDGLLPASQVLRCLSNGCFLVLVGDEAGQRALDAVTGGAYAYLVRPLKAAKVRSALRGGLRNRQRLLGIMALADDLRQANRRLTEQKRTLQEEKRALAAKTRQLNLMGELSRAAGSSLDPGRILAATGAQLGREIPLVSWLAVFAPPGSERAGLFLPGQLPAGDCARLGSAMLARLGRLGGRASTFEVCPLSGRRLGPEVAARLLSPEGLMLPLLAAGHPIGLLRLLPARPLGPDLIRLAEGAANMVALGLRNAGELLVARRLADHDAVTRLANRRAFERQLSQEFSRSRRYRQPLTLVMADIDHFKRVNDLYGHQMGDQVLAHVARQLAEAVRESDFVARYGGEEFAVILPQTGLESSLVLAERIKEVVEGRPVPAAPPGLKLSLSLGLADTAAPQAEEPPDLVRLADHALYLSKRAGRSRISTWRQLSDLELTAPPTGAGPTPWQPWEIA